MRIERLFAVFIIAIAAVAQSKPAADLIITHAKVWSVDQAHPSAQAVAVLGDRIVAVGSAADVDAWRGPHTHVLNAGGKLLLPGFNDAHVHFVMGGEQLESVQLNDATSPEEFAGRIAERAGKTSKEEWIRGGNWDETKWNPATLPTKELIDKLTPNTAVFVVRYDGHMGLANSVALRLAGITAQTPDPPGGVIVRDAQGNPTGILKDAATEYVNRVIPPMSHEQRLRTIRHALAHAASLGVTSIADMNDEYSDSYADIEAYSELLEQGELTARVYVAPSISDWPDQAKIGLRHAFGSSYLRVGALKGFADGSLGSRTAYFFEPFDDDPSNRGLLRAQMQPLSAMRERMMRADASGLQVSMHAIGDQAISMVLDLYSEVEKSHGACALSTRSTWRPRISIASDNST